MEKKQTTKNVLINKLVENIKNENPTNYATLEPDNTSGCWANPLAKDTMKIHKTRRRVNGKQKKKIYMYI